jgi:hypothetical protein
VEKQEDRKTALAHIMNPEIQKLALSPRGRKTLGLVKQLMDQAALHLDSPNRDAFRILIDEYWNNPATCNDQIEQVLGEEGKPKIFVAVDLTGDHVKLHIPKALGDVEVFELEVDDPDHAGYRGRGLPHPEEESEALERDRTYETITVR